LSDAFRDASGPLHCDHQLSCSCQFLPVPETVDIALFDWRNFLPLFPTAGADTEVRFAFLATEVPDVAHNSPASKQFIHDLNFPSLSRALSSDPSHTFFFPRSVL
jgi:hypothetical protein